MSEYQVSNELITVEIEGKAYKIRKEISWGERNRILSRCITVKPGGAVDVAWEKLILELASLCIIEAPFEVTKENLENLKESIGTELEKYLPITSFRGPELSR